MGAYFQAIKVYCFLVEACATKGQKGFCATDCDAARAGATAIAVPTVASIAAEAAAHGAQASQLSD